MSRADEKNKIYRNKSKVESKVLSREGGGAQMVLGWSVFVIELVHGFARRSALHTVKRSNGGEPFCGQKI